MRGKIRINMGKRGMRGEGSKLCKKEKNVAKKRKEIQRKDMREEGEDERKKMVVKKKKQRK